MRGTRLSGAHDPARSRAAPDRSPDAARARRATSALATREGALDYAGLEAAVGALAGWLAGQGLRAGDRVATWLPKTRIACLMPLAAARAGLVHVPVNPLLKHLQVAAYSRRQRGARCC